MQQPSSLTRSNAFRKAQAAFDSLSPAERAKQRAEYEQQRSARERAAVLAMRERTVKGRVEMSGIPVDYRDSTVREPAVRAWVDAALAGSSEQLVIRGTNGTGKTTQACAALMELTQAMTVRFATLDAIQRAVSGSWIDRSRSPAEVLAAFTTCGCLLIDDLGQTPMNEKSTAMLLQIISERIGNAKPTVYTTNYEGEGLYRRLVQGGAQHANAIMDRLSACRSVELKGPSMRRRVM